MHTRLGSGQFFGAERQRLRLADLALVEAHHAAGSSLPRHAHAHAYLCINHSGVYVEDYGRRSRSCRTGMIVFHPIGEVHRQRHDTDVHTLNVELGDRWLTRAIEDGGALDRPVELAGDAHVAARLRDEMARPGRDAASIIEELVWQLLGVVARGPERSERAPPRWLRQARELLHVQFREPVSLDALAQAAGVHPVHFAAAFRRFMGCSAGEYARRLRLEHARRQLADPELSLAAIAADAGFADQSHFSRAFKRFTGQTPRTYRAALAAAPRPC